MNYQAKIKSQTSRPKSQAGADFFLPDFCQIQSVFLVLLIAELLALLFTLLNLSPESALWSRLGLYSISIQSISLCSVAVLCFSRSFLSRFNDWVAGGLSLLVILTVTASYSIVVIYFYWLEPITFDATQRYLIGKNLLIGGLIGAVALRYFYLLQQYRRQEALESAARLEALQARIRPHFLFNSMNVIASLTRIDPQKAERAIEDLSDLFRATLNQSDNLIPLQEELENGRKYLALEQIRLGERLSIIEDIESSSLPILLPALSVQPLLENAVYHGIQQLPEGGTIGISAKIVAHRLNLVIENPFLANKKSRGNGIALNNISERLSVIYSGQASLTRESENGCYRVTLSIPINHPTQLRDES